jgi:hypothetical protein
MPLDATVKGAAANSYLTETVATTYLTGNRLYTTEWSAATTGDREKALIWATKLLDECFEWEGSPTSIEQALRWPRVGVTNRDGQWEDQDAIPTVIQNVVAEFAHELVKRDRLTEPEMLGLGLDQVSVGPVSASINPAMVLPLIPRHIAIMLTGYGEPIGGVTGSTREIRLRRA